MAGVYAPAPRLPAPASTRRKTRRTRSPAWSPSQARSVRRTRKPSRRRRSSSRAASSGWCSRWRGRRASRRMRPNPPENRAEEAPARSDPADEPWAPRQRLGTCVATLANSRAFGRMVAAEAKERDFYRAARKAFVADGAAYNWKLQQRYFTGFVPIADFLHVLCYVYRAAWAVAADEVGRWQQYLRWLRACWQGRVAEVIEQLQDWQGRVGRPPPGEELPPTDPRRAVAEALSYFGHNAGRMRYPEYRRAGLPVTSSLVESLVGEVNARVKSKQKYWNRGAGAEAILQLRAAVLSEDGRLERYLSERPGSPYRRRQKQGDHTAPAKVAA